MLILDHIRPNSWSNILRRFQFDWKGDCSYIPTVLIDDIDYHEDKPQRLKYPYVSVHKNKTKAKQHAK